MASLCSFTASSFSSQCDNVSLSHPLKPSLPLTNSFTLPRNMKKKKSGARTRPLFCAFKNAALQYRNIGDSDLNISEITLGTMTFGEQNTEKEAHDILHYAFDRGINALDTSEAVSSSNLNLHLPGMLKSC
uniref:Protein ta n=1 Tax=Cajanus cajan TaxID=3821 RepID=A0A151T1T4_CAJCA|nr:Protein ta [Cajanus cajan]